MLLKRQTCTALCYLSVAYEAEIRRCHSQPRTDTCQLWHLAGQHSVGEVGRSRQSGRSYHSCVTVGGVHICCWKMGWEGEIKTWLTLYTDRNSTFWVCKPGRSTFACGVVILYIPSFLDDLLLLCCWLTVLAASWDEGLPVPAPSIFSISFSIRVPF